MKEFVIYPGRMKQLQLIKLPKAIIEEFHIKDQKVILIGLLAEKGKKRLNSGHMFKVTSGGELYIPKIIRDVLKEYDKITFSFKGIM